MFKLCDFGDVESAEHVILDCPHTKNCSKKPPPLRSSVFRKLQFAKSGSLWFFLKIPLVEGLASC